MTDERLDTLAAILLLQARYLNSIASSLSELQAQFANQGTGRQRMHYPAGENRDSEDIWAEVRRGLAEARKPQAPESVE